MKMTKALTVIAMLATPILTLSHASYAAENCDFTVESNDRMQFNTKLISVPATCEQVSITLKHTGDLSSMSMGHNIVISDTKNVQAVGSEGMRAGIKNSYVKPGDERVYAFSDVIGGGESTTMTFTTEKFKPGGDYTFFCSFPGHWAVMQGKFEFK